MTKNFNTYIEHIDVDAWREVCVNKGSLRHFAKGEEFVSIGEVGRYFGFIQSARSNMWLVQQMAQSM